MKIQLKGIAFVLILSACFALNSNAQTIVKIKPAKPKVIVVKPAKTKAGHFWRNGHWKWNKKQNKYVWVKARWVKNNKGHHWIPGKWKQSPKGYIWVKGHWKKGKARRLKKKHKHPH